jgi:hypothetical protein
MILIIGVVVVVLIAGVVTTVVVYQQVADNNEQTITNNPTYQTIIPSGRSINWQRISPPGNDPVYAFPDKVNNIAISVSEQPLPSTFKNDTDTQINKLAKSYNANDTFTAGKIKAYIGTSAKGPQSVIFTESGLLILMKSEKQIDTNSWKSYIASLE